jgi:hypothetical protein
VELHFGQWMNTLSGIPYTVTDNGTVTNWRKKMKELEIILKGLDRINEKLEQILRNQKSDSADWMLLVDKLHAPPKKSHKEVLDEAHE